MLICLGRSNFDALVHAAGARLGSKERGGQPDAQLGPGVGRIQRQGQRHRTRAHWRHSRWAIGFSLSTLCGATSASMVPNLHGTPLLCVKGCPQPHVAMQG